VVDPAHRIGGTGIEAGAFGDQQYAAAAGTLRPAETFTRQKPWRSNLARGLDDHRRASATNAPSPHPDAQALHAFYGTMATPA
jgi:hypothetical protein